MTKRPYHHGDLEAALVEGALMLLAEDGLERFSVARLAKRVGVSPGAPYRHFSSRGELLAVVATRVAAALVEALGRAMDDAGGAADERLAAMTGAYVRFVLERGVGLELVFAPEARPTSSAFVDDQSRRLLDLLLPLAQAASPDARPGPSLALLEAHLAIAEGYATLRRRGPPQTIRLSVDEVAQRAISASLALTRGAQPLPAAD